MRLAAAFLACVACSSTPAVPDASAPDATTDVGVDATFDATVPDASAPEGGLYGIPWNADGLSNDQVGYKPKRQAAIRFRSTGGTLAHAKVFFIVATYVQRTYCNQPPFSPTHPNNCYAAGTGGVIRVDLVPDDGTAAHAPSANVLATTTLTDPMNVDAGPPIWGASGDANFRVLDFSAAPTLAPGALYHLVFTNIDADPVDNYISIDCLVHASATNREPGVSDTDLATIMSDDGVTWTVRRETPVFEVDYADGTTQGQGYMGTRVTAPAPIAGGGVARETFTPAVDRTVRAVSVRLGASGAPGPLGVRLERGDGTLVEAGTLDASSFPDASPASWATFTFASPHVLSAGQAYHLVLTAPAGDAYTIYPLEKGKAYGFDPRIIFPDGHAEYDDGDAGFVADYAPWGNMSTMDYQLYFTLE